MKKLLFTLLGVISLNVFAQRTCGTYEKAEEQFALDPVAQANRAALKEFLIHNDYKKTKKAGVVTIPVVVHIIYKTNTQNISEEQILSQLKVLNDDYSKMNADFDNVVPEAFKPFASDMELAFCLATVAPDGSPTNGIERKQVANSFNFDNNYYKASGLPAWDPTKYLNMWVGPFTNTQLLGWAYPPDFAGAAFDGFCVTYRAFGTIGTAGTGGFGSYNKGRTATHEIGHYFGLAHIWGDSNDPTVCGTTINNDGCDDTPATSDPYFGTPTYPNNQYTCENTADGAMFMNYMDYVDDKAMAMFTNDQKTIAQNVMVGPRASLLNSNACATLGVNGEEMVAAINVFPSPATNYISIASPLVKLDTVEIFGSDGKLVKKASIKNETDKIDVTVFSAGVYYIRTYKQGELVKSLKFIKK